jgi:hypothetical protein
MWNQKQAAILQFAPGTRVAIPQFDEIDRPVIFRAPSAGLNFSHILIHLHEGSRAD